MPSKLPRDHADAGEIDPVCGMAVRSERAADHYRHEGRDYWFCSEHCRERFAHSPTAFLGATMGAIASPAPVAAPTSSAAVWTCPMHPEIRADAPGACPICGMVLEPLLTPSGSDDGELRSMTKRFWVTLTLTVPVFVLAMAEMLPGRTHQALGVGTVTLVQLVLSVPVVLWPTT